MNTQLQVPRSPLTNVPGWETFAEQLLLLQYAQQVPENGLVVEIGAEYGMSASIFCVGTAGKNIEIYSVDLFPGNLLEVHRQNLMAVGFDGLTKQVQGDSSEVGGTWPITHRDASKSGYLIDLLFVDGDHSYKGVRKDILAWSPLVKLGGIILFHDCACPTNMNPIPVIHQEVTEAIDDTLGSTWRELPSCDSIRVFIRMQ